MGSRQVAIYSSAELIFFECLKRQRSKYLFRRGKTGQKIMEKISSFDSFTYFACKQGFCSSWRAQQEDMFARKECKKRSINFGIPFFKITCKFIFDTDDGA